VDFCCKCHLCQVKIPTQVLEAEPRPMPIPKPPFKFLALDYVGLLPGGQKYNTILVVLDCFSCYTYLFPSSRNIDVKQTAQILLDKIFTIHRYPFSIVSDRDS
jgi:hypothetical protein